MSVTFCWEVFRQTAAALTPGLCHCFTGFKCHCERAWLCGACTVRALHCTYATLPKGLWPHPRHRDPGSTHGYKDMEDTNMGNDLIWLENRADRATWIHFSVHWCCIWAGKNVIMKKAVFRCWCKKHGWGKTSCRWCLLLDQPRGWATHRDASMIDTGKFSSSGLRKRAVVPESQPMSRHPCSQPKKRYHSQELLPHHEEVSKKSSHIFWRLAMYCTPGQVISWHKLASLCCRRYADVHWGMSWGSIYFLFTITYQPLGCSNAALGSNNSVRTVPEFIDLNSLHA